MCENSSDIDSKVSDTDQKNRIIMFFFWTTYSTVRCWHPQTLIDSRMLFLQSTQLGINHFE